MLQLDRYNYYATKLQLHCKFVIIMPYVTTIIQLHKQQFVDVAMMC
jgi:hypothetical protein